MKEPNFIGANKGEVEEEEDILQMIRKMYLKVIGLEVMRGLSIMTEEQIE